MVDLSHANFSKTVFGMSDAEAHEKAEKFEQMQADRPGRDLKRRERKSALAEFASGHLSMLHLGVRNVADDRRDLEATSEPQTQMNKEASREFEDRL